MRILRGLTSRFLACGCTAGVYETYNGEIVTLLDERDASCQDRNHDAGNRIHTLEAERPSEIALQSARQQKS